MPRRLVIPLVHLALASAATLLVATPARGGLPPADALVSGLDDLRLRALAAEVLASDPVLAAARSDAEADAKVPLQARALPDPMLEATWYARTPEGRTGPQLAMVSLSQTFPWSGKRALRGRAAEGEAAASLARYEALRIERVTEARLAYHEVAYLDAAARVARDELAALAAFEDLASSRHAAGSGILADALRVHAEATRARLRLLELESERALLVGALNALRGRPGDPAFAPVAAARAAPELPDLDTAALVRRALLLRPELQAARAGVDAAEARVALARKAYRPDVTAGVVYGIVGPREDDEGKLAPPEGNGMDDLGFTASIDIPLRRRARAAGVEEAVLRRQAAAEELRAASVLLEARIAPLASRAASHARRLSLVRGVLALQADEVERSTLAAYGNGLRDAGDVIEALRARLDVALSAERARADLAIALAELEGLIGAPLGAESQADDADVVGVLALEGVTP